jgi:hypothetical protein
MLLLGGTNDFPSVTILSSDMWNEEAERKKKLPLFYFILTIDLLFIAKSQITKSLSHWFGLA